MGTGKQKILKLKIDKKIDKPKSSWPSYKYFNRCTTCEMWISRMINRCPTCKNLTRKRPWNKTRPRPI